MSLSEEERMDLMAYSDGELEGEEATRVEQRLANDLEAKAYVESLRFLSSLATERIRAKLEAMPSVASTIASHASRPAQARVVPFTRRTPVAIAIGTLAVAASVAIGLRLRSVVTASNDTLGRVLHAQIGAQSGTEVERVEAAESAGVSVFYLDGDDANVAERATAPGVVVWIQESLETADDSAGGDR